MDWGQQEHEGARTWIGRRKRVVWHLGSVEATSPDDLRLPIFASNGRPLTVFRASTSASDGRSLVREDGDVDRWGKGLGKMGLGLLGGRGGG
jgi:hypothetical protein